MAEELTEAALLTATPVSQPRRFFRDRSHLVSHRAAWAVLLAAICLLALHWASEAVRFAQLSHERSDLTPNAAKEYVLPSLLGSASLKNAKTVTDLQESIQLERRLQQALAELRKENARERNAALRQYLQLSQQSARRTAAAVGREVVKKVATSAGHAGRAVEAELLAARDSLEHRFPTMAKMVHQTWSVVVGELLPRVQRVVYAAVTGLRQAASPILVPAAETVKHVALVSASSAKEVLADGGNMLRNAGASALHHTVGKHPRVLAATLGAAVLLEHHRKARVHNFLWGRPSGLQGTRPSNGDGSGCPEGMATVTVGGTDAPQCALIPVCAKSNPLGNCPPTTPAFPHRSSCRAMADNSYGCVLDELEAPLEEEVQT
eukprot:GGOE01018435.1.p1 GENE.GGOE01018435.1~~GGOE01018435.1.p1  ORF type:complete len:378 (+),score=74.16 GGOE01018435.1:80-1213(+)